MTNKQLHHDNTSFSKREFPIRLICDRVNSPANIGSLFRLSDSFGIEHIHFCGEEITVVSKRMLRTSRSTHQLIPHTTHDHIDTIINQLQKDGYTLIALEITNNSIPITEYIFENNQKIALIIGDENLGVSETILKKVHSSIHIPMYGANSSMNVAMAAGIALFEITKQLATKT